MRSGRLLVSGSREDRGGDDVGCFQCKASSGPGLDPSCPSRIGQCSGLTQAGRLWLNAKILSSFNPDTLGSLFAHLNQHHIIVSGTS